MATGKPPILAGHFHDKFKTRNPVARFLVSRYKQQLRKLVAHLCVRSILEVGCGEGYIVEFVDNITSAHISAIDLDSAIVSEAVSRCPSVDFAIADGLRLPYGSNSFDLVLACEVLEHVESPDDFLREMRRVSKCYCLLSVPREPIWRVLNLLRGAYVSALGNTPGHIQHWSAGAFIHLLSQHFRVLEVRCPLPWTMALVEV